MAHPQGSISLVLSLPVGWLSLLFCLQFMPQTYLCAYPPAYPQALLFFTLTSQSSALLSCPPSHSLPLTVSLSQSVSCAISPASSEEVRERDSARDSISGKARQEGQHVRGRARWTARERQREGQREKTDNMRGSA